VSATEQDIARDYAQKDLEPTILGALRTLGKDIDKLVPEDLSPVDEFHIGGRRATEEFAATLSFPPGAHLLDIGCGLGGASRHFAGVRGCRVSGIDLTDEFVHTAAALAKRVHLDAMVSYRHGSALELPFPAGTFDGAYMLHVGMNIADKAGLFAEARRVLKPGARFGVYDVMRDHSGDLAFPMPWAATAATSFVEPAVAYRALLEAAGFEIVSERNRRDFAVATFAQMRARASQAGPPALGLHIVMGPSAPQKVANMIACVERGLIAPVEIVARAV
jgi:ubiquinone/menaquinone biosynthesis C-methylase UbiE